MAQAWLDSLSEDWVSQPGSEDSPVPSASLPKSAKRNTATSQTGTGASRIPRPHGGSSRILPQSTGNSSNILSERSANEINIPHSRCTSSKLSQEIKVPERGRHLSRSVSASTAGSVVHNTVNHKSHSASPTKSKGHTPEWKRRLIQGNIGFGEQRDLFTSATTGLENMFKPPMPGPGTIEEDDEDDQDLPLSSDLLSSPPLQPRDISSSRDQIDESVAQMLPGEHERPKTRAMQYRMTEVETVDPSSEDMSALDGYNQGSSVFSHKSSGLSPSATDQGPSANPESRKVSAQSGQSVLRNEDFSPIVIAPEKHGRSKANFGVLEVPPLELQQRLEKLRWNQMALADEINSKLEGHSTNLEGKTFNMENTEEYEKAGAFINFRRGGRSADGSFRHRQLSPPLNTDTSEMLPEESLQASTPKQFPTIRLDKFLFDRETPPLPRAPNPSPQKQGASGSPLKLFGPYDTFTNQTLMRRISQFEDQMSDNSRASVPRPIEFQPTEATQPNNASVTKSKKAMDSQHDSRRSSAQFGAGELDGYSFDDGFSRLSEEGPDPREDESAHDPEAPASNGSLSSFKFDNSQVNSPPGVEDVVIIRRRQKSATSTTASSKASTKVRKIVIGSVRPDDSRYTLDEQEVLATPKRRDGGSDGKRPRTSPSKDPTPKRRRTLHKTDVAFGLEGPQMEVLSVQSSHQHMHSAISRKRRDARDGDLQQLANAKVLATRQMLRPRTPTPSQRSSIQREQHPYQDAIGNGHSRTRSTVSQANVLDISIREAEIFADTGRKPSIKTEDFMQEANKIMEMLRNRGGRQSDLTSVEESEAEIRADRPAGQDVSFQESTKEPFSRPPSREGRPIPRVSARQDDPDLIARLKMYEERSDLNDLISSSMRSIGLAQDAIRAEQEIEDRVRSTLDVSEGRIDLSGDQIVSDPPNIRISQNPSLRKKVSKDGSVGDGFASRLSTSSGNSTGRSIPSGSSRGSDSRKTIAPQTVSHLIGEEVGNMVLDKDRNIWIKRKNGSIRRVVQNVLPSEISEDDPFADIPDLSVDTTRELQNLQRLISTKAQDAQSGAGAASSTPSPTKSAGPTPGRKPILISPSKKSTQSPTSPEKPSADKANDIVDHEISIFEDRVNYATPSRKNLTITFSSPIASIIQDVIDDSCADAGEDATGGEAVETISIASIRGRRRQVSIKTNIGKVKGRSSSRGNSRGPSRQFSVGHNGFVPRPVSRIEERDEDSGLGHISLNRQELGLVTENKELDQVQRQTSLSFVVATPRPPRAPSQPDQGQVITQYVGTMSLTPMSDFTIHHDQSLGFEASYIVNDRRLVTGDRSKEVMSQTLRHLVDRIAEVEPFEPYWEEMEELDIHDKRLSSLHKLDEFCNSLVTIDASHNSLRNLNGVPHTVRHLKIVHNQLSELTSWNHLSNLQYVDISNNNVRTLSGLQKLVHLRSLKADNCDLASLDTFKYHDAIQVLRARGNLIEAVDFAGSGLNKLTDLDLEGNQIKTIINLDQLPALSSLNLRRNALEEFSLGAKKPLSLLRSLDISDNELAALDISLLPSLRQLHADRNRLVRVKGFFKTPRLDSLSLREQTCSEQLDITCLYHAYEIRKLYLSGNLLESFNPPVDFLNLQLLELANCGLTALPETFGQMMPNLRKLNLNFNALSDLSCLLYIPRLKKLHIAGNRLVNAYSAVDILAEFAHLTEVDFRDNCITQGFYGSSQALATTNGTIVAPDPFTLADADVDRDKAYRSRLDLRTGMRRRVYETIVGEACKKLKKLDGLPVDREIGKVRDAVWMALAADGVFVDDEMKQLGPSDENETVNQSSRWAAEDSFA